MPLLPSRKSLSSLFLEILVGKTASEDLVLHLFTNDYTPPEPSTRQADWLGHYVEVAYPDYAPLVLEGKQWLVQAGETEIVATHPKVSFTFPAIEGSGVSVFGYYLTRSVSGHLAWGERFGPERFMVGEMGGRVSILPRFRMPIILPGEGEAITTAE